MKTSLIANSGIQFVEINTILKNEKFLKKSRKFAEITDQDDEQIELVLPYFRYDRNEYIIQEAINPEARDPDSGRIIEENIHDEFSIKIDDEKIYKISYQEALELFEESWIPIPYFRTKKRGKNKIQFQDGPTSWARMYIAKKPLATTKDPSHTIILAFDTRVRNSKYNYETLKPEDVEHTHFFNCPSEDDIITSFYTEETTEWVYDWLTDLFDMKVKKGSSLSRGNFMSKFAGCYLTLLTLLHEKDIFPTITVFNNTESQIDVHLVLDIGNSRTCGLILESSDKNDTLRKAQKLIIRDLSSPDKLYDEPFEMRTAFVHEKFGNENYLDDLENSDIFSWPSLVRVGPEAAKFISLIGNSGEQLYHISSPKRYLWDKTPYNFPWKSIPSNYNNTLELESIFHGIANNLTYDGKLIVKEKGEDVLKDDVRKRNSNRIKPIASPGSPKFSRGSIMTFTIFELLLQALSQINSIGYRTDQGNSTSMRKLKSLVVTCPTAMSFTDQTNLRNAADDAVDLLKIYFDDNFISNDLKIIPKPINTLGDQEKKEHWMYDEATCSQLTFIYGEIHYKFNDNVESYFNICGKHSGGLEFPDAKNVTIASIDIGGGTTDLMICAYQIAPNSNNTIHPQPIFWEGFNLAGDDLLKRIIERIILPQIRNEAIQCGLDKFHVKSLISDLFGPNTGKTTHNDEILKNLVVNQIILPIAYGFIDYITENSGRKKLDFDSFFINRPRPNHAIIKQFNERFNTLEDNNFNIESINWLVDGEHINLVIKESYLGELLLTLCSRIAKYSCDYVLLSGRPTQLPVIKEIILKNFPVSPDKIISLGNHRIGNWYPFSKSHHEIKDSKTVVSVGAAISFLSEEGQLDKFNFNTTSLQNITTTANYIGKFDTASSKVLSKNVYFDKNAEEGEIIFSGGTLLLGKRQFDDESWVAAPIYQIKYKTSNTASELRSKGYEAPFKITLIRSELSREKLKYEVTNSVLDKNDKELSFEQYFSLTPQSLTNEDGYWMDTGCFVVDTMKD